METADKENRRNELKKELEAGTGNRDEIQKLYGGDEASLLNDLIALWVEGTGLPEIQQALKLADAGTGKEAFDRLASVEGHPLWTFSKEAENLDKLAEEALKDDAMKQKNKAKMWDLSIHDMKKGDLLYPTLNVKYRMDAPSKLLWDHDVELRTKYSGLMRAEDQTGVWNKNMDDVLEKIRDMVWVEENLLYPLTALKLDEKEWEEVYQNSKDYAPCLNVPFTVWSQGESLKHPPLPNPDETIVLGGGELTVKQLDTLLNALPLELTFVDINKENKYFNLGHKAFKRPTLSLNHEVYECHPAKVGAMVKGLIDDFQSGKKDKLQIWMIKQNEPYFVTYMALRTPEGEYLGTLEIIQPMEEARKHFEASADFRQQIQNHPSK